MLLEYFQQDSTYATTGRVRMTEAEGLNDFEHGLASDDFLGRFNIVIASVISLPTLPTIIWEVQGALQDKENGAPEIAHVIEQDPSLTGNILRLSNSVYFASSSRIVSVADAVTRIGLREIGMLANATIMIDTFSQLENTLDYKEFWRHSLQVAEIAGLLIEQNTEKTSLMPTEAYMLGLLHDVGKLLLDQYFEADFVRSRTYAEEHSCPDADAEYRTLGMEHGEVAARLMDLWNLPLHFIEAVRYHHNVDSAPEQHAVNAELVRHADALWHLNDQGTLTEEALAHPTFSLKDYGLEALTKLLNRSKDRADVLVD